MKIMARPWIVAMVYWLTRLILGMIDPNSERQLPKSPVKAITKTD
jgi:hypothetical protein